MLMTQPVISMYNWYSECSVYHYLGSPAGLQQKEHQHILQKKKYATSFEEQLDSGWNIIAGYRLVKEMIKYFSFH